MGALAVIGLIAVILGILGLLGVLHLGLTIAIVLCVAGLVAIVFSRDSFTRR